VLIALLDSEAGAFAVPSKTLAYLCAGRALIVAAPAANEAAQVVEQAQAGLVVSPDGPAGLIAAADRFLADRALCARFGTNGRQYAEQNFSIDVIAARFLPVLSGQAQQPEMQPVDLALANVDNGRNQTWKHPAEHREQRSHSSPVRGYRIYRHPCGHVLARRESGGEGHSRRPESASRRTLDGATPSRIPNGRAAWVRWDVRQPIPDGLLPNPDLIFNLAPFTGNLATSLTNISKRISTVRRMCAPGRPRPLSAGRIYEQHRSLWSSGELKNEESLPVPDSPYGSSKLAAEKVHMVWQAACNRRKLLILRPGVVFAQANAGM